VQTVSVNKQLVPDFDIEAFDVKKVDYVAVAEQCQVKYHIDLHCVCRDYWIVGRFDLILHLYEVPLSLNVWSCMVYSFIQYSV
jgi:hypothetical protein